MWEQHFTPETWGRLKDRGVPYGWRDVPYPGIEPYRALVVEDGALMNVASCWMHAIGPNCLIIGLTSLLQQMSKWLAEKKTVFMIHINFPRVLNFPNLQDQELHMIYFLQGSSIPFYRF